MFRILTEAERAAIRYLLTYERDESSYTYRAVDKLMQNYQDTATELAEHEAALDARIDPDYDPTPLCPCDTCPPEGPFTCVRRD